MANYRTIRELKPYNGIKLFRLHKDGEFFYYAFENDDQITTRSLKELKTKVDERLRKTTVNVGVYADRIYPDWWERSDVYGDDNEAVIGVKKEDLIEWINETGDFEDFDEFYDEYTYDDTDGLYNWLKDNGKHVAVMNPVKQKKKEYECAVILCGGYANGEIKVKALSPDEAYEKAMDYVANKLCKAFPTLDIEYNVEVVNY